MPPAEARVAAGESAAASANKVIRRLVVSSIAGLDVLCSHFVDRSPTCLLIAWMNQQFNTFVSGTNRIPGNGGVVIADACTSHVDSTGITRLEAHSVFGEAMHDAPGHERIAVAEADVFAA